MYAEFAKVFILRVLGFHKELISLSNTRLAALTYEKLTLT